MGGSGKELEGDAGVVKRLPAETDAGVWDEQANSHAWMHDDDGVGGGDGEVMEQA
jgi:hypothetical protein